MTKYEVYQEGPPAEEVVRFRLRQSGDRIWLVHCDENGATLSNGNVLSIANGTVRLCLAPAFPGIERGDGGYIKVVEA